MRRLAATALAITTVLGLGATAVTAEASPTSPRLSTAPAPYIVVLDNGADTRAVATAQASRFGFDLGHVYTSALQGYSATMSPAAASALEALPGVQWVQADRRSSIDAQTTPTGINRVDADASPTAAINGVDERVNVDVAVIDTGVDLDHPDLNVSGGRQELHGRSSSTPTTTTATARHVAGTIGAHRQRRRRRRRRARRADLGRSRCSTTPAAASTPT